MIHSFSYGHIKRWRCIRCRLRQWSQIISAHAGDFQCRISGRNLSFSSSLGLHSFEFWRVLTATRQQWTLDSDSELDFDGFVTVEFGENGLLRQIWLLKRCGLTSSSWLGCPMSTVIRVTLTALLLRCPWQRFFDIICIFHLIEKPYACNSFSIWKSIQFCNFYAHAHSAKNP